MPASLKLKEALGDDLNLLFVESQGLSPEDAEGFALKRKWMGVDAMWTTERPFSSGSRGLPSFVLLSNEGEVLLKGYSNSQFSAIDETVRKEISRARKGPPDAPTFLRKAFLDFEKGNYSAAFSAVNRLAGKEGEKGDAARDALKRFRTGIDNRLGRIARMIEQGHFLAAGDRLDDLVKAVKGVKGLKDQQDRAAELKDRFTGPELRAELDAARDLAKYERKIRSKGLDDSMKRSLRKFAEKRKGTHAAIRAERLAAIDL